MMELQVYANGDVSFCKHHADIPDEHYLGNVRELSLSDIFNSEKNRRLWKFDEKIPDACTACMRSTYWYRTESFFREHGVLFFENPFLLIGA
jgi:radical SAM protein with 4Fe4S-binding SPASM domain